MTRFALGLEYDGTDFAGWQIQRQVRSVQSLLADAISHVANESVRAHGAGRTDSGVHAAYQVAHFDSSAVRTHRQWLLGINSALPADVAVRWIVEVGADFDARRSAIWRSYRYVTIERATRPALARRHAWWIRERLDCEAMATAAAHWLGEQDFSAFRAANCQSTSPIRQLADISIRRVGDRVEFEFRANAFLYHMVRNMMGALVEIGKGRAEPAWGKALLLSRDRTQAGVTAPAHGLTLINVVYPERFDLPLATLVDHRWQ